MHTESSNLLSVLDELNSHTLSDGGIRLLGLDTDFLENDSLGVGRATEGRRLEGSAQKSLLERLIGPSAVAMVSIFLSRLRRIADAWGSYLSRRCVRSLRAALRPLGLPLQKQEMSVFLPSSETELQRLSYPYFPILSDFCR